MSKPTSKSKPIKRILVRLELDLATHDDLRLAAAKLRIPMAKFAREAVAQAVQKANGGK